MANTINQAFKNLKMRSQIISLDIMILLLVLGIAGVAIYVEIKIFYYISERSLENTLINQDIKQISLSTHLMKHYIKEKHKISILLADHISSFLFYYSKIQSEVQFTNPMDSCFPEDDQIQCKLSFLLQITYINKLNYYFSLYIEQTQKMCYSIYGNIEQEDAFQKSLSFQSLYNGLRLLEEFGLELNKFYPDFIQFVDITDINFNCLQSHFKIIFSFIFYPSVFESKQQNLYIKDNKNLQIGYCIRLDIMSLNITFIIDHGMRTITKGLKLNQINSIFLPMFTE